MLLNFLCFLSLCLSCFLSSKIESQKAKILRKDRDISVKGFWSNPGKPVNRQEGESVIEVVPQEDLLKKPHNLIGRLDFTDSDNYISWCTGFIAQNERLVVFAAHCLFNNDGTMTTDFKFYLPGPNLTMKSFDIERIVHPPFNGSEILKNINCTNDYAFAILSGTEGAGDFLHMQPRPSAMPAALNLTNGQLVFTYGFLMKGDEVDTRLRRVRTYLSLEPKCKKGTKICPYDSENMLYIQIFHLWEGASGGPWIWYYGDESIEDVETHIVIGLLSLFSRRKKLNNNEYSISPKISEAFWVMMEDSLAAIREQYPDSFV